MAHEWNIKPRGNICAKCGREFADKEECISALFQSAESPDLAERNDFCMECWKQIEASNSQGKWQGAFTVRPSAGGRRELVAHETAESLLRRLLDVGDSADADVIYILAVMLERKKQLIEQGSERVEGGIMRTYLHKKSGDVLHILDPELKLSEIADVQQKVLNLLNGKGEEG